jgi:hypothetical protein
MQNTLNAMPSKDTDESLLSLGLTNQEMEDYSVLHYVGMIAAKFGQSEHVVKALLEHYDEVRASQNKQLLLW